MLGTIYCLLVLFLPSRAMAYLDPGSGSIMLQALIASVTAAGATVAFYWRSLKDAVTGRRHRRSEPNDQNDPR